jgi:hypothetical protein
MLVPVCYRPSVAEPMEAQDRTVMETKSAAIHRKMPMPARQLSITGFAHKAGVVGDDRVRAIVTTRDMAAERRRATTFDGRHRLQLVEAYMAGVGFAPYRPMTAKDIRDLKRWTRHGSSRQAGGFISMARNSSGLVTSPIVLRATRV